MQHGEAPNPPELSGFSTWLQYRPLLAANAGFIAERIARDLVRLDGTVNRDLYYKLIRRSI